MDTDDESYGHSMENVDSDERQQLKCQPCLEEGDLQDAVGMCVDCRDFLCLKCYNVHTLPKPTKNHQLLDRDQLMQSQNQLIIRDVCTEKCPVHEDKVIKFYCTVHSKLGCKVCVKQDHFTCKGVEYIPQAAKGIASNEEYEQVEMQLKSALKTFKEANKHTEQILEQFVNSSDEALVKIKEYRQQVEQAFDEIENKLVEKTQTVKAEEINELETIRDAYKKAQDEVQISLEKMQTYKNAKLTCSSYTEMMKTKEHLKSLDSQVKEAGMHTFLRHRQITVTPNQDTLDTLKNLESFGHVYVLSTGTLVSVKHDQDINVKSATDGTTCGITGSIFLTNDMLVLADYYNKNVKTVHVQNGQMLSQLGLSCGPWDITSLSQHKVAVTMPVEEKVAIVIVGEGYLSIESTLAVSGTCFGIDYRNDNLAVSFGVPYKVQVINLQGIVLFDIASEKLGNPLLDKPLYVKYGQDDTTLYVSNYWGNNVVCMNLDGSLVATYTDRDLQGPRTPVVDSSGNVYVSADGSHTVHQISRDCKKLRVLLTESDGLSNPCSICLNKEEDKICVGSFNDDFVKVYDKVK